MHTKFDELVAKLKTHYPANTPIAIVFYAGYKQKEHVVSARLDTIIAATKDTPPFHLNTWSMSLISRIKAQLPQPV